MKRMCAFCASSEQLPRVYHDACSSFGKHVADSGWTLVFGGGGVGLMGTLAESVKKHGGRVCGIIPSYLREGEGRFPLCDDLILTETLAERKKRMIDTSDAFAVLPGGYGTLDETFEVLTLKRHGLLNRPLVFLNTGGFFDPLMDFFERLSREGFLDHPFSKDFYLTADPAEAVALLTAPKDKQ